MRYSVVSNAIRFYLTIAVPILLVLIIVRLVMSPLFLRFEYYRADFPDDPYGLTTAERMEYAPYALDYLLNGEDISYLGDLTFPNGRPLFNARELRHMEDVKVVTRTAYFLLFYGGLVTLALTAFLARRPERRRVLYDGLFSGAVLTLTLIGAIVVLAVVAWDVFFTGFHDLFFASGTWRFNNYDTLIRLFPERFWFDAALTIGGLSVVGAVGILIVAGRWRRRHEKGGYVRQFDAQMA